MSKLFLLLLAFMPAFVFSSHYYFHYKKAELSVMGEKHSSPTGVIYHEDERESLFRLYGVSWKGNVPSTFQLIGFAHGQWTQKSFEGIVQCGNLEWEGVDYKGLIGSLKARGAMDEMNYEGMCNLDGGALNFNISVTGQASNCIQYEPAEGALRVQSMFGKKYVSLHTADVVTYATIGHMATRHKCKEFLGSYKTVAKISPGFLMVAKDGSYCAIISKDGDKFVHAGPRTSMVVATPLGSAWQYFPGGYIIKDYSCGASQ